MTPENQKKHDTYLATHGRDSIPASNYFINHKNFTIFLAILSLLFFVPTIAMLFIGHHAGTAIVLLALVLFVWWLQISSIKEVKEQGLW